MLKVGITGGIGSGKSLVSKILTSMQYPVFNSDEVAKQLSDSDPAIKSELIDLFGEEIYLNNRLNRPFLASKIFENESLRQKVNAIIHPRVRKAYENFCDKSTNPLVFNEAAILIETGAYKNFDRMVLVTAPKELRIARVQKRDNATEKDVKLRIEKQWSDEKKREFANVEIINDEKQPLLRQVEQLIDYLTSSQGSKSSS